MKVYVKLFRGACGSKDVYKRQTLSTMLIVRELAIKYVSQNVSEINNVLKETILRKKRY